MNGVHVSTASDDEKNILKDYLALTPVSWISVSLAEFKVERASISSLRELASLETLWSELGGVEVRHSTQSEKFHVREAYEVLSKDQCRDAKTLAVVNDYIDRMDEITMLITIVQIGKGRYRIFDGNKRAIAYYERCRRQRRTSIDLEVFLLTPMEQSH